MICIVSVKAAEGINNLDLHHNQRKQSDYKIVPSISSDRQLTAVF